MGKEAALQPAQKAGVVVIFGQKKKRTAHRNRVQEGRDSHRKGTSAEWLCRFVLMVKGYRILASRYKTHQGEIDIIATRGRTLAFIEVKARPDEQTAGSAVSVQQQARLARAASLFLARTRGLSGYDHRFDVMLVLPWRLPRHIQAAFYAAVNK